MYCPQCSTESFSTSRWFVRINADGTVRRSRGVQYCRVCGAKLRVVGLLPKIKEMVKNLRVKEDVSGPLERMNKEIALSGKKGSEHRPWISFRKQKTPAERREENITKGIVSFFSGTGLTVFLYYLSAALVLKLPPQIVVQIPFEIDPVVRMIWLLGLIPTLSGLGHIVAGLLIRPQRYQLQETEQRRMEQVEFPRSTESPTSAIPSVPDSVTDHTTELLQGKRDPLMPARVPLNHLRRRSQTGSIE